MDLLSSIRKSGSRGGVNFSWDEVATSQHRENYLGHSLMAPVGRWQKGKDLTWYAKGEDKNATGESAEERRIRERKEEIQRIKEAEEDALARALGLPVTPRGNGEGTGANAVDVKEINRVVKETKIGDDEIEDVGKGRGFGEFVGKFADNEPSKITEDSLEGGLIRGRRDPTHEKKESQKGRRDGRSRSRSRERRHHRHRHRSRSAGRERHHHRRRREEHSDARARSRSRSRDRKERRYRSRSGDRQRSRRDDRYYRHSGRDDDQDSRRSRSPQIRDRRDAREYEDKRH
ncbi:kinase phosphorylation protein-domain-containing protein [Xylogone sp. PMI_703]|nr:kinase phosphorylation protein-domain-containing protein [Xylogone sp. PMI_703]